MVLTICFDPVLESKYYVDRLLPRVENLANKKIYNVTGKGIISGRILNNLNIDVFATGFLGGLHGQYIFNKLKDIEIYNDFIFVKDETKSTVTIIQDNDLLTSIIGESPRITREELGSFYSSYGKVLDKSSIVIGQGNLPIGLPNDIYYDLINLANRNNKKFILEAKGEELKYGLEAIPFMVKLDKEDLEHLSHLQLDFENEIIKVGYSLLEKGIELVCIDLDEKGSIVLTKDRGYRLELDNDADNLSKDQGYMVAGFAFGLYKSYDLETTMRLGQASRLAYAMEDDLDRIDMSDIKRFMTKIDIMQINY
ncbi:MAG: PfkB family carbohydrate kinase [Tissierellaceae bacterium]|nr:PfkB family carbohydrate kinase [Tissierellaceae bacterium]